MLTGRFTGRSQMNTDKLNSWGVLFRFITPILVTIALFILSMIRTDIIKLESQFSNHLSHHQEWEKMCEHRFSVIETLLRSEMREVR